MINKKDVLFEILLAAFCDSEIREAIGQDYKFFEKYLKEIYYNTCSISLQDTIDIITKLDTNDSIILIRNAIEEIFDIQSIKNLIVEKEKETEEKE